MQTNRTPDADEPRITTPQWALDRAAEIGAAAADKLSALGVRIVGDISTLGARVLADRAATGDPRNPMVAVGAAREAVVGTIISSGLPTVTPVEAHVGQGPLWASFLRASGSRARGRAALPPVPDPEAD